MLPEVEYVKILVSRRRKQVVFEPSDEMDIEAYRWSRLKDGKRYASQRTGNMFVMMLCKMMGSLLLTRALFEKQFLML